MSVQWLRHLLRLATLLLIVALPLLAAYRVAHPPVGSAAAGRAAVLLEGMRGNTWSLQIGALSLSDPLGAVESLVAGKALVSALLLGLALPVLVTVVLGRVFCAWVCPVGFLLELGDKLRHGMGRIGLRPRNIAFWRGNKYVLLVVGLIFSAALATPLLSAFYPPALLVGELHRWAWVFVSGGGGVTWGVLFLLSILLVELFVSRRMWCRYLCPGGALYNLLGWRRTVRISLPDEKCDRCGDCVVECGMGLNPMDGLTGLECDNCLVCVDVCPPDALANVVALAEGKKEGEHV